MEVTGPAPTLAVGDEIRSEQTRRLAAQHRAVMPAAVFALALVVAVSVGQAPPLVIGCYAASRIGVLAFNHALTGRILRGGSDAADRPRLGDGHDLGMLLTGSTLGTTALLVPTPIAGSFAALLLLMVVIASQGVLVSVASTSLPALRNLVLSTWLVTSLILMWLDDPYAHQLAVAGLVYGIISYRFGLRLHRAFVDAVGTEIENRALLDRLVRLNAEVESQRRELATMNESLSRSLVEVADDARRDALTGTWNRRGLEQQVGALGPAPPPGAVLLADLDRFKQINDSHGHLIGDRVLAAAAAEMSAHVRPGDVIGRWGGEEFVIVLPATPLGEARRIGERLRRRLRDSTKARLPDGGAVTVSIGCARLVDGLGGFTAALAEADAALYRAKQGGRNRVAVAGGGRSGERGKPPSRAMTPDPAR